MKHIVAIVIVALVAAVPAVPAADEPVRQGAAANHVPLRIQVVLSRSSGEKKLSSVPYTLSVVANDNDKTSLRMGMDVPVPQTVLGPNQPGNFTTPQTSYSYRPIGTDIDCAARTVEGYFKLDLAVSDRSVILPEKSPTAMPGIPVIRTFTSTFNVLLRDGQTAQHTAATDPVSGEVLRIDVTLNVLK